MSSSKIMAHSLDDSVFDGIVEMMQELKTDIATMKESLATKSDMETLQNAVANLGGKKIKSIQKGIATETTSRYYVDVTISSVNTSKAFIFHPSKPYIDNDTGMAVYEDCVSATLKTSTSMRLFYVKPSSVNKIPWLIIEFE